MARRKSGREIFSHRGRRHEDGIRTLLLGRPIERSDISLVAVQSEVIAIGDIDRRGAVLSQILREGRYAFSGQRRCDRAAGEPPRQRKSLERSFSDLSVPLFDEDEEFHLRTPSPLSFRNLKSRGIS